MAIKIIKNAPKYRIRFPTRLDVEVYEKELQFLLIKGAKKKTFNYGNLLAVCGLDDIIIVSLAGGPCLFIDAESLQIISHYTPDTGSHVLDIFILSNLQVAAIEYGYQRGGPYRLLLEKDMQFTMYSELLLHGGRFIAIPERDLLFFGNGEIYNIKL